MDAQPLASPTGAKIQGAIDSAGYYAEVTSVARRTDGAVRYTHTDGNAHYYFRTGSPVLFVDQQGNCWIPEDLVSGRG